MIDGSPIRMGATRSIVDETIIDKSRKHQVRCWFMEANPKTFALLKANVQKFSGFSTCIQGDANVHLGHVLEEIDDEFAFVYIDPFGLGNPVFAHDTVLRVLERPHTELFIHFSFMGVERCAGQLANVDHTDVTERERARSVVGTLDRYMGGTEWHRIWQETPNGRRRDAMRGLYLSELERHYDRIEHLEMPPGSSRPYFELIFTTRNGTGQKIMQDIMATRRRRGSRSLEEWLG